MKTQIESLSEWIEKFTLEAVPEYTREQAKLQVLDCFASISAGFRCAPGQKIYRALKELSSVKGDHTILPTGESWTLENAVYLHASLINALELDNFPYMGHTSESAFSVALAITEKTKATNEAFLESLICAQEVSGRLGAYMAAGKLQGHMRSFIHRVGAAVATVKLYKCSSGIIAHAIAISLSSPELPMIPGSFSPDTKITCVSSATVEGMRSAFLAMNGFEGSLDIIEHPAGFVKTFSSLRHMPDFWQTLGKTWCMDSISFKFYSSCAHSQGPVNAVLDAIGSKDISEKDISAIHLYCPLLTVVMEEFSIPHYQSGLSQVNINFSTKRSVSAAILYKGLGGDFFADHNDQKYHGEINKLSEKVFIHHSWKYTIEMMKGLDASLENAGYPGVLDTGNSEKSLKYFKKVYKSRTLFEASKLSEFLKLPNGYFSYLIKRVLRSFKGKYGFSKLRSAESDLSKLQIRIGTEATIHFHSGEILTGTCDIPRGFAGDPDKKSRVLEKFERECKPIFGPEITARLLGEILAGGLPKFENQMYKQ